MPVDTCEPSALIGFSSKSIILPSASVLTTPNLLGSSLP